MSTRESVWVVVFGILSAIGGVVGNTVHAAWRTGTGAHAEADHDGARGRLRDRPNASTGDRHSL